MRSSGDGALESRDGRALFDTFSGTAQSGVRRREVRDGDGYHPGVAGHEVLAGIVVGPFLAWLDQRLRDAPPPGGPGPAGG
ncbi:hypothetical protein [Oerskovia sp. KBS0722]|uniref:hypothetical protein n=1 Tax=Oerskovia sp. KBS0722 TaxID=1179673 RepID=UPI00110D8968|nr:hypothetical protein [Oerskovia sp. KBS0722]QDW61572.1 hypothetical protein FFI11_002695 [Oerskovia sp. KBS0722]